MVSSTRAEALRPGKSIAMLGLVLAACAGGGSSIQVPLIASDPLADQNRYETCSDAEGMALYDAAVKRIGERQPAAALPLLQQAVQRCPDLVRAHVLYQDSALDLSRSKGDPEPERAMRAFYAAWSERPGSPVVSFLKARLLEDTSEQVRLLEEITKKDGRFAPAWLSLGRIRRSVGQLENASADLRSALSANPRCSEASLELAEVLVQLGKGADASQHFRNYLLLNPGDRLARQQYAQLLIYDLGQPTEARELVEELRRQDPGDVGVLMDLAAIEWKTSRGEVARDLYKKVLELDRTQSRAALNLGNLWFEVYSRAGDPKLVEEAYAKARKAYLYYRNMRRHEGVLDALDFHMGVPYRIKWIEEHYPQLAADKTPPGLNDF